MKYINSKLSKFLKLFLFIIITVICMSSLFLYLDAVHYLDIDQIDIKHGKFNISESVYTFSFKTKFSEKYNLIMTIHDNDDSLDDETYRNELETHDIEINIVLKENLDIIKNTSLNQKDLDYCHYFGTSFSLCLLGFESVRDKEYYVQIKFKMNTDYYDKRLKELFIQRDYDPATMPWAEDFKKIFFYVFCISLSLVMVMIVYYFHKKRNKRN
ncbi:MAG: hypothetical protein QG657_4231 [Acidobacteriota bacterium]|nr:hypothetical protein [Acidobacteriota bacterium]